MIRSRSRYMRISVTRLPKSCAASLSSYIPEAMLLTPAFGARGAWSACKAMPVGQRHWRPTKRALLSPEPSCEKSILPGFASATAHTSYCDRITRPTCTPCQPIPAPDLCRPFSPKPSRFPYRKVRLTRRYGNMQARDKETVNRRLNYLDRYFPSFAPGRILFDV